MAGTASTSTPVTVTNADGSTTTTVTLTYRSPAPVVVPPVTLPPVVTAPAGGVTSALAKLLAAPDNIVGNLNGFMPPLIAWPDISTLPANGPLTAAWLKEYASPTGDGIHADCTMPIVVKAFTQAEMTLVSKFDAPDGVDNVAYPITLTTPATNYEGGGKLTTAPKGDRHYFAYNKADSKLYELYNVRFSGVKLLAYAGRVWDLTKAAVMTLGRNSCDAAGMPIAPLLPGYDEVQAAISGKGYLDHPLRVTFSQTNGKCFWPAVHVSDPTNGNSAYLGAFMRLLASYDISKYSPINKVLLMTLRMRGAIIADNGGNNYIQFPQDSRWDQDDLALLHAVTESNCELVTIGPALSMPA